MAYKTSNPTTIALNALTNAANAATAGSSHLPAIGEVVYDGEVADLEFSTNTWENDESGNKGTNVNIQIGGKHVNLSMFIAREYTGTDGIIVVGGGDCPVPVGGDVTDVAKLFVDNKAKKVTIKVVGHVFPTAVGRASVTRKRLTAEFK